MTNKELKDMANRIKECRKSYKYTQESFSETIGISYGSYARIENAFQKPALDTLIKISKKLKVSLDYIVFGTNEAKPNPVDNSELLEALLDFSDIEKLKHTNEVLNKLIKIKNQI